LVNWSYRLWQFWKTIWAKPTLSDRELVEQFLAPPLVQLFERLDPSEQAHAVRVCRKLIAEGETNPLLLTAALLHDIGKICYPLRLWERVWIVLFGGMVKKMAKPLILSDEQLERAAWWKRPLLVGKFHPSWGAEILRSNGVDERIVWLVQYHQDANGIDPKHPQASWLQKLGRADELC
jgi:hypothetical protein